MEKPPKKSLDQVMPHILNLEEDQPFIKAGNDQVKERKKISQKLKLEDNDALPKELQQYQAEVEQLQAIIRAYAETATYANSESSQIEQKEQLLEFARKIPQIIRVIFEKIINKNKENQLIDRFLENVRYFFTSGIRDTDSHSLGLYYKDHIDLNLPKIAIEGADLIKTLLHELFGHSLNLGGSSKYEIILAEAIADMISYVIINEVYHPEYEEFIPVDTYDPYQIVIISLAALCSDTPAAMDAILRGLVLETDLRKLTAKLPEEYRQDIEKILLEKNIEFEAESYYQIFRHHYGGLNSSEQTEFLKTAGFKKLPDFEEFKKKIIGADGEIVVPGYFEGLIRYDNQIEIKITTTRALKLVKYLEEKGLKSAILEKIQSSEFIPERSKIMAPYIL